ncbi:GNAT family N-acetyltransferase [Gordonia crocea]|uniref:N-acetyltransferase GCN5 n=1 Tax=Gordonia crocea TaxID=589162 RepID=A0A7I9UVM7_9ACTN|nr:GNAT family protein [Gordonia crocea]GED97002.1 N-acetyltransferase GCN5 [Gordonia crocea]
MFTWGSGSRMHPGWPARLGPLEVAAGGVVLRPIKLRDGAAWSRLRVRNQDLLVPWEPTTDGNWAARHHRSNWPSLYSVLKSEARRGAVVPFVIEVDGEYAGQLTIGNVQRGAVRSAWIGYWVDRDQTGRGVATAAVALGVDHAFGALGLHRLEATVQPTNAASRSVLTKVGFRHEGLLKRYMDVDGRWRDHDLFALTTEEVVNSAAEALVRAGRAQFR